MGWPKSREKKPLESYLCDVSLLAFGNLIVYFTSCIHAKHRQEIYNLQYF